MPLVYLDEISYYVFYGNILIIYRMMRVPLGKSTLLQTDKKFYLKDITFIPWESVHKNIKSVQNRGRLFTVQTK